MFEFSLVDVVGILDIDWKSLMPTSKPTVVVSQDALERFSPANLFRGIGVSKRFAGIEYTARVEQLTGMYPGSFLHGARG